jgi:hypothetical protein
MLSYDPLRLLAAAATACSIAVSLAAGAAAQQVPAAGAAVKALTPGAARIWFYRDYEPYGSRNFATVSLNGATTGSVPPDGSAFYRDVPAGRYHITVDSSGSDVNQDKTVDLGPGQEAFVKILASTSWESSGDETQYSRDTFYVSLVPPQIARSELPAHPLRGG